MVNTQKIQPHSSKSDIDQETVITAFDLQRIRKMLVQYKNIISFCNQNSIEQLCDKLVHASVVDSKQVPPDVVTMNSSFLLREVGGKELTRYTLVFPEKGLSGDSQISVLSPMGCSLLGSRIHDEVINLVPAGIQKLKVEKIVYQPEAAGDYHL